MNNTFRDTFRLGRIAGIPIGLNWTWLLVFALFLWSLASAVFPSTNPGLGTTTDVAMVVVAVVLFFGSLLLHELGHALQARHDGGEIGDIAWATRIAAGLGRGIGGLMIVAGVIMLFTRGAFGGVWLALIGWFVLTAADAEARLVSLQSALDGLVVSDLITPEPIAARVDQTFRGFMTEVPWDDDSTAYPVVDGSRAVGMLPARRLADTPMDDWTTVRVRDRMVPLDRLQLLKPDDPALDAMLALARAGSDSALVLEDGHLAGIVYARDVADAVAFGRSRPWGRGRRNSGSAVVQLHPRPGVPRHDTAPPRDAA